MKKVSVVAAVAGLLLGLASVTSQAASTNTSGTFNVSINFTSSCTVNTASLAPTFTYVSNQVAAATAGGTLSYSVTCTSGVPYTMFLDSTGGTFTGTYSPVTNTGTYNNTASTLNYTLTLPAAVAGTGAAQTYTLSGSMAGGQAGKCNLVGGCPFTDNHTLTITY